MAHARKRIVESARGDGNCAFNAFVLGLVDPNVLNNIRPLADNNNFVISASAALNVKPVSWNALKAYLLSSNTPQFRLSLQQVLSPLLRKIAIDFIVANPAEHLELTTSAMQVELQKYFIERINHEKDGVNTRTIGDIFIRHPFIKDKFEALYQSSGGDTDVAQIALTQWWQTTGHKEFLTTMAQPALNAGNTDLYAGDLELAPLGAYFGANIRVDSTARGFKVEIHRANGALPIALVSHTRALADRNIVKNDLGRTWVDLPLVELTARLDTVPQYDELMHYVQTKKPKAGDALPPNFGMDCLEQLGARGIINLSGRFIGAPTAALLAERATEFGTKAAVIKAWTQTYRPAPMIELQNQHAAHWNNLQPAGSAYKPSAAAAAKKPVKSKTKSATTSTAATTSALTTAAPYKHTTVEREVNNAVNEVFELLDSKRRGLPAADLSLDKPIAASFEKAFADFTKVLGLFAGKRVDESFTKAKQKIIDEVKLEARKINKP